MDDGFLMHRRVTFPGKSRHRRGLTAFLKRVSVLDIRFVLVGDIVVLKILFLYVALGRYTSLVDGYARQQTVEEARVIAAVHLMSLFALFLLFRSFALWLRLFLTILPSLLLFFVV